MSYRDIDILPGRDARAILKEVEKFTAGVMRPAGIALDNYPEPADVFVKDSPLWDVFSAFRELDLHLADIPEALGGVGTMDGATAVRVAERLGYADAGLAIGLIAAGAPFRLAARLNTPAMEALARQFCEDREGRLIGCRSISFRQDPPEGLAGNRSSDPDGMLAARADGSDFIVNGEISNLVNAVIATHGAFDVLTVLPDNSEARGMGIIPLDLPGITRPIRPPGNCRNSMPRGTLRFVDVRVPGENIITGDAVHLRDISRSFVTELNQSLAAVYAGLARAALDEALQYARKRVQGGVPIFEHRNIRLQLFAMFKMVEAARACVSRLAGYHDQCGETPSRPHAVAARCFSVETACQVTSEAIQIFGGYGLAREFPLEKFFRDARLGLVENGITDDLAIDAMREV